MPKQAEAKRDKLNYYSHDRYLQNKTKTFLSYKILNIILEEWFLRKIAGH